MYVEFYLGGYVNGIWHQWGPFDSVAERNREAYSLRMRRLWPLWMWSTADPHWQPLTMQAYMADLPPVRPVLF